MRDSGNGMRERLRSFVADHREGWSHGHWESLLHGLREGGFDTAQPEQIGLDTLWDVPDDVTRCGSGAMPTGFPCSGGS